MVFLFEFDAVLRYVGFKILSPKDLCDAYKLVSVIITVEEHVSPEDLGLRKYFPRDYHAAKRTSCAPHVQAVIVGGIAQKKLGRLERSACNSDFVLPSRHVIFSQTEVYQAELPRFRVDDNIVGFDVTVHDAPFMASLNRDEQLVHVPPHEMVLQVPRILPETFLVDVVKYEDVFVNFLDPGNRLELDYVRSATQVLKDLYLAFHLNIDHLRSKKPDLYPYPV